MNPSSNAKTTEVSGLLKLILCFFIMTFLHSLLEESLFHVIVILAVVVAWFVDRKTFQRALQKKFVKVSWLIITLLTFINFFLKLDTVQQPFNTLLLLNVIASISVWPITCYLAEYLPNFSLSSKNPTKARPDILSSQSIKDAVKLRCIKTTGSVYCGEVDEHALYLSADDRAVIIGPPGTGKTAFLITQILEWIEQGYPFVVNDIKPEIYGLVCHKLEQAGYKVITYNPTAGTGFRYNPFSDVSSTEAMGELIASFIPSLQQEGKVFSETARDLLDGVISHLKSIGKTISLPLIRDFFSECTDHEQLLDMLAHSENKDARHIAKNLRISAKNERFLGSVMATLNANLRFLRYPKIRESLSQSNFSLSELCHHNKKVALFLQFEEIHQEITELLFSALINHLMRFFIEHTQRPPVLLLLDEIGNVPPVMGLVKKLNTIRSRNLPTWLYFQSKEQMQRYGIKSNEGANIILGACDFHMVLRLNDNATANWMSEKIGTVDRLNTTVNRASLLDRHISQSLQQEPIIFPHTLQQLPNGQAIASYRGLAWRNTLVPYYQRWIEFKGIKLAPHECRQGVYGSSD